MKLNFAKWFVEESKPDFTGMIAQALVPALLDPLSNQLVNKMKPAVEKAVADTSAKTAKDLSMQIKNQQQQQIKPAFPAKDKTDNTQPGKAFQPAVEQKPNTTQYGQVNTPNPGDKKTADMISKQVTQNVMKAMEGKPFGQGTLPKGTP